LSATQAKVVLSDLLENGGDPAELARNRGYEALAEDSLNQVMDELIADHPDEWGRYVGGDDKLAGFFTGLAMKATQGKANGKAVAAELRSRRG
jgi:aspartyl-tRNA(Asn)/glutamyl-tRNA(Gln) amidotransferase subunit B